MTFKFNSINDIMDDHTIRSRKKVLSTFKEIEEQQFNHFLTHNNTNIGRLQQVNKEHKIDNMRNYFYTKINTNNIFYQPCQQILYDQSQNIEKRLIKYKGFKIKHQKHFLSIFYMTDMIFLLFTYLLTSFMSCIDKFVASQQHHQIIPLSIILITTILCFSKLILKSGLQKIHRGILLEYVGDILQAYVHSFIFYVDFIYLCISITLFFQMVSFSQIQIIQISSICLFICTMIRIIASRSNLLIFKTTFIDTSVKDQLYKLIKLMLFNFMLAHFVASMFLAMTFIDQTHNWLITKNLQHEDWDVQYMWSFYWSCTTMTSVGYGDLAASTYKQAYIIGFLELTSCIILAYNITEIGNIVYSMRLSEQQYAAKIATFKRMSQQNHTNHQLQTKIESYLRQQKQIKLKFQFNQQAELLKSLPQPLWKQFVQESSNRMFRSLPFFKSLHKNTLFDLVEVLVSKVYYPGQSLVKGDKYNANVMILKEGKVGLVYKKYHSFLNGVVVQQIIAAKQKIRFGKVNNLQECVPIVLNTQFLSPGKIINYDINTLQYSFVQGIQIKKLLQIIKNNRIDAQYYFGIIHSHKYKNKQWFQFICERCSCKKNTHLKNKNKSQINDSNKINYLSNASYHNKFDCPKLHFMPWKNIIVMKHIKRPGQIQLGSSIYRRKKQKQQCCLILRKRIFNKYEQKRFINERKKFQQFVNIAQTNYERKLTKNYEKKQSEFKNIKRNTFMSRTKSINYHQINQFFKQQRSYKQINSKQREFNKFQPLNVDQLQQQNYFQQEIISRTNQQVKTIIDAIRTSVQDIIPKNISQKYWDLQIDMMYNYRNYFPQNNSSSLDNFPLCKIQSFSNKKILTILGQALNKLSFRKESNNQINLKQNQDLLGIYNNTKNSTPEYQTLQNRIIQNKHFQSIQSNKMNSQFLNMQKSNLSNVRFQIEINNNTKN